MSRKHQELESGRAVWDTESSLYDSYELAAVRRLLDRRLLAAAGVLALRDGEPPPPAAAAGETRGSKSTQVVVVPVSRVHQRKVTLRRLFRAVATWAAPARPRRAPPLACACTGMVHDHKSGGDDTAVEPDLPPHSDGQL